MLTKALILLLLIYKLDIVFLEENILRSNSSDVCKTGNPCQHGGVCISTDNGPICECRNSDYGGKHCEKANQSTTPVSVAAEKDLDISIQGETQSISGILNRQDYLEKILTPAVGFTPVVDDLVFSKPGFDCNNDTEDECPLLPETGFEDDDLIIPVYIPSKMQILLKRSYKPLQNAGESCDDEDCFAGSGSGDGSEEPDLTSHATDVSLRTSENATSGLVSEAESTSAVPRVDYTLKEEYSSTTLEETTVTKTTLAVTIDDFVNVYPSMPEDKNIIHETQTTDRINTTTSSNGSFIIGIIVGVLIVIILISLVILKCRQRSNEASKFDERETRQETSDRLESGDKAKMQESKKRNSENIVESCV